MGMCKKRKTQCKAKSSCHSVGKCNKGDGKCSNPPKKKGVKCDDKNLKTVDDQCDGNGVCKCIDKCANVGCQAKNTCYTKGVCNKFTGKCSNPRKKAGASCDDKGVCKGINKCAKVKCTKKKPVPQSRRLQFQNRSMQQPRPRWREVR